MICGCTSFEFKSNYGLHLRHGPAAKLHGACARIVYIWRILWANRLASYREWLRHDSDLDPREYMGGDNAAPLLWYCSSLDGLHSNNYPACLSRDEFSIWGTLCWPIWGRPKASFKILSFLTFLDVFTLDLYSINALSYWKKCYLQEKLI